MRMFTRIEKYLRTINQWLINTPDRALEQAYNAAQLIKKIEDEHFEGDKITRRSGQADNVSAYFQAELSKYLRLAKLRVIEFRASNTLIATTGQKLKARVARDAEAGRAEELEILEKLRFIDSLLARYRAEEAVTAPLTRKANLAQITEIDVESRPPASADSSIVSIESAFDTTSFIPRSIFRTANRFRRELDPRSEEEVLRDFRQSKARTVIALRFLAMLLILPLLTQQLSKNFVIGPIVDYAKGKEQPSLSFNPDLEEEALEELERFEHRIKFEQLIGAAPQISQEEIEALIQKEAADLAKKYTGEVNSAIKNVFADLLSLVAFSVLIVTGRREIEVLKSFIDEMAYGLSDSAKAFLIILFTDVFVGFHSTHGWEVLMEGILRHFGLPENRDFIYLFIATFPVILDAMFKYWIFRYLNRISPSAVATYKNMNE